MPKVVEVPEDEKRLYAKVCKYCRGTKVDPINMNECRRCGDRLSNVHYQVLEGLVRNQLLAGAAITYSKKNEKFCLELLGRKFYAEHLIDAVSSCWSWRHANEVGCVNLEVLRG